MKVLFAAVATAASLAAGLGVNVDSESITPAAESLIARNEVQIPLVEQRPIVCTYWCPDKVVMDKLVSDKLMKVIKVQ